MKQIRAHLTVGEQENISMFSTCSELTPCAPIPDGRMERIMQPWLLHRIAQARSWSTMMMMTMITVSVIVVIDDDEKGGLYV